MLLLSWRQPTTWPHVSNGTAWTRSRPPTCHPACWQTPDFGVRSTWDSPAPLTTFVGSRERINVEDSGYCGAFGTPGALSHISRGGYGALLRHPVTQRDLNRYITSRTGHPPGRSRPGRRPGFMIVSACGRYLSPTAHDHEMPCPPGRSGVVPGRARQSRGRLASGRLPWPSRDVR